MVEPHLTPILNELYLSESLTEELLKSIKQILSYCLFQVHGIVGFGLSAFKKTNLDESRKKIYRELVEIFEKVQDDFK